MPRGKGMKPIHILVPEKDKDRIDQHAREHGYKSTADYIRHLIKEDIGDIDLSVKWGGHLAKGKDET